MAFTRRLSAMVAAATLVTSLSACAEPAVEQVNYAVDGLLSTYNSNTVDGAASAGPQAFARTLTGFSFHGPGGQALADNDFGTATVVGREPLVIDYQISDEAQYSDGKPVTCDDMVLAWAAQSGRFAGFNAASKAGYLDIAGIECQPGQKKARVNFLPTRSVADYNQLFTATSLMPSHVLSDQLGLDVTATLQGGDPGAVGRIAEAWNTAWDLKPGLDSEALKRFPSSGPYKIDSVLDGGAVVLVANDKWWGTKPVTKQITVWPRGVDVQDRINNGSFQVVDVATGSSGTLTTPDEYQRAEIPSSGIQQLIFAAQGPVSTPEARRAMSSCVPRDVIAANAAMPIANTRLNTAIENAYTVLESGPLSDQYNVANPDAARMALGGQPLTVRLGYQAPDPRLAAAVAAITQACAPAGITVVDVTAPGTGPQALRDGRIDALLAGTGGAAGSGSTGSSAMDAYALHSGNGNNLSGYANPQVDGIIAALAVTSDPKEEARLLGDAAPMLWTDVPTLPLYRQQRTVIFAKKMFGVQANPTKWGAGWNMDRWRLEP
ncbi:MAG: ABC transporter substrate-binding protein [Mycobacterium sp.]